MIAANMIDPSLPGTNTESCFLLLPYDGVSLCLHLAVMMLARRCVFFCFLPFQFGIVLLCLWKDKRMGEITWLPGTWREKYSMSSASGGIRIHSMSCRIRSLPAARQRLGGGGGGGDGWGDRETRGWGGTDLCREAHHTKRIYLDNVWVKYEKLLFLLTAWKKTCWFEMNQRSQCKIVKWQQRWRFTKPFVSLQRELGKYCIWKKKKKPITSNEINPTALLGVIHTLMSVYNWLIVTLPLS